MLCLVYLCYLLIPTREGITSKCYSLAGHTQHQASLHNPAKTTDSRASISAPVVRYVLQEADRVRPAQGRLIQPRQTLITGNVTSNQTAILNSADHPGGSHSTTSGLSTANHRSLSILLLDHIVSDQPDAHLPQLCDTVQVHHKI